MIDLLNNLIRTVKGALPIRIICFPFQNIRHKNAWRVYQQSPESEKFKEIKDLYRGKRCFIIGNGASLSAVDLDMLADEITFAGNRIYNIFPYTKWRPTYYLAEDSDGLSEMLPNIINHSEIKNIIIPFSEKNKFKNDNVLYAFWTNSKFIINRYNDRKSHISEDISNHFSIGYTVTFSAIQLAIYMGFKEIYLIGVDYNYSLISTKYGRKIRNKNTVTYFDNKERKGSYLNYYSTMYAYNTAKKYCDTHNIKIYNATRGGKLEVFERVDLDKVILGREQ